MSRELALYDSKSIPEEFGLVNSTGVSCHFNALLQCLFGCSAIMTAMRKSNSPISDVVISTVINATNTPRQSHAIFQKFIETIAQRRDRIKFTMSAQQSACEGLVLLIDAINDAEINRTLNHKYSLHITCPNCNEETSTQTDYSIHMIMPAVTFPSRSEFCRYITNRKERLEAYTCEKCNVKSHNVERYVLLKVLPEIVIIVLSKYMGKVRSWFPSKLVFLATSGKYLTYCLVSQVEHFGNAQGGHYVARSRRLGGVFLFNDSFVTPANFNISADTTILFYHIEKITSNPPPDEYPPKEFLV